MSCFDNLIALRGGCTETTLQTGGMYLNDIGINRKFIDQIITEDYKDADDFVARKIDLAIKTMTNDVLLKFSPKFNPKSIIKGQRIGFYTEQVQTSAPIAGTSKGIQAKIYNETTFINFYLSSLSLFVHFTGTVNVQVWDLMSNKLLDTIPVSALTGQIVTVTVNKVYESNSREMNLAIIYDASTITGYQTPLIQGFCGTCYRNQGWRGNKYLWANAVSIPLASAKVQNNLNFGSDTGGLSINYSLQCNHLAWLCTNANFMALALLYKTGYLIAEHTLNYTDQMNSRTLIDVEKTEKRKEDYDFEYNRQVDGILKNLRIPTGGVCFVCDRVAMVRTVLPA